MKKLLYLVFILWSSNIFGQTKGTTIISDTTVNETWTTLSKNWKYQKGDNPTWANSTFNDSNWEVFSNWNLNMPDNKMAIADRNEIAWFRKRIMADSSVKDALVLNIYQLGASEIYLDGKLIHQLGSVNANRDSVVFMNPFIQILQLPISIGKEQVLAIRYVNAQYKFPISTATNGAIRLAVSTLSNANSADIVKNKSLAITQKIIANYHIATGLAILMFIIFLSFYLFFPSEKINGYFSLSNFLLICFTYGVIVAISTTGDDFWIRFFIDNCIIVSFLLALYCGYCILEHKIDTLFKISVFLLPIAVILFFFYDPNVIAPISGIIVLLLFLRVAVNSWKKNSTGSLIFLISNGILFTYWTFYLLDIFGLIQNNYLYQLIPFAFMINPIALSIYLGYAFGKRSQDLRLNLEKVQQLSKDKEQILSKQNETLEQQVKERTASLNESLNNLKSTQSQLIQSEKMASLGELTAGIAHEIQNPLNFVNNFSEVNKELLVEMKDEMSKGNFADANEIANDVIANEEKINHHGKRADAIVKGMLQHSRSSSGVKEPTDINALCDEYLRLSYHGLRAKDSRNPADKSLSAGQAGFNATMKTDFDASLENINIIPQDIGRVVLNLLTNAFYAVDEKKKASTSSAGQPYEPTVSISTKKIGDKVEIRVIDNGNGIPEKVLEKIFQPFFTTKPTGQGTGLGLSLSYDIVTKGHEGELKVETMEGEGLPADEAGTTFIILLPANK